MGVRRGIVQGLLAGSLVLAGCGALDKMMGDEGGADSASGDVSQATTTITGKAMAVAGEPATEGGCAADSVVAVADSGDETAVLVQGDCSFSLAVIEESATVIRFRIRGTTVAILVVTSGTGGFATTALVVDRGRGSIDLGDCTVRGRFARPSREPFQLIDSDGDGRADLLDDDDDNDGIADTEEADCDLDGIVDDLDRHSSCSEEEVREVRVLEVKPRNDPHPELGEDTVDLDKVVKARVACDVDQDSVTSETFRVATGDDAVTCVFAFAKTGRSGTRIKCQHEVDFLPDAVYTATLDGVKCKDGRTVQKRSWSWKTASTSVDGEDSEDALDSVLSEPSLPALPVDEAPASEGDAPASGDDSAGSESPLPSESLPLPVEETPSGGAA